MSSRRSSLLVATVLGLVSCGHAAPEGRTSRPAGLSGVVVDQHGVPAARPVIVVMQASDGAFVAFGVGGDDGAFDVDVPPGSYTITIASSAGFARLSPYAAPAEQVKIPLREGCSRVSGRVTGDPLPDGLLWLRAMTPPYDYVGVRVEQEEHYEVCVPDGDYYFEPEEGFVTISPYVDVPTSESPDVVTYRDAKVVQPPEGSEDVARPLVPAIPAKVRVIGLGESNHGSREFLTTRERLTRELATSAGVRYVMLEAGAGEMIALNDYVQGASVDARKAVSKLGYWMWDVEEFLSVLESLREYNASLPPEKRVQLLGLDVQDTEGAVDALVDAAKQLGLDESELGLLSALREESGARAVSLSPDDRVALDALLGRLAEVPKTRLEPGALNLMLAARSLVHRLAVLGTEGRVPRFRARDRGMSDMVLSVLEAVPDARVCLWAHNAHVGVARWEGLVTMGQHLHAALGDEYFAVALLSYSGEARAWDEATSVGVIPHELEPAPAHSIEGAIVARSDADVIEVPFSEAPRAFREWLRTARYTREFGAGWLGADRAWSLRAMDQAFDAAVVIRKTSPTTPTATGVRTKVAPPAAE